MTEGELLPCPFCGWEKIRIMITKKRGGPLKGSEYVYCWCKVCGTRGPYQYTLGENEALIVINAAKNWNDRQVGEIHKEEE